MFDTVRAQEAPPAPGAALDEDWFDPAWRDQPPPPEDTGQCAAASCAPSGWAALELDYGTADPTRLSDAELIDTIVGFERLTSWAGARQAELMAEFARRRPGQDCPPNRSEVPTWCSGFAPDEIALALRLSRTTAANRMAMAETMVTDLPATLAAWASGTIDTRKAQAITETSYVLTGEQRAALEARVLPRAGTQTLAQLRACLTRAVLGIDPDGAAARFQQRRKERRVEVNPDSDGMATLWRCCPPRMPPPPTNDSANSPAASVPRTPAAWTPAAPTCSPICSPAGAAQPPPPRSTTPTRPTTTATLQTTPATLQTATAPLQTATLQTTTAPAAVLALPPSLPLRPRPPLCPLTPAPTPAPESPRPAPTPVRWLRQTGTHRIGSGMTARPPVRQAPVRASRWSR